MKLCSLLLLASLAHAVGVVQTSVQPLTFDQQQRVTVAVVAWNWTGDASNGTVPSTAVQLSPYTGYFVVSAEFVPLTPSPTNGYAATITDAAGVDVLAGAASPLSSTNPQGFAAATSASPIQGTLTLNITGQAIASAKGTVFVFIVRPGTVNTAAILHPGTGGGGGGGGTVTSVGLTGTANQITITGASPITTSGSWIASIPTNPTLPGTTTGTFSGNLTGNVTGNVSGTAATITGQLALANTPLTTNQDILYDNSGVLGRLPLTSVGNCLGNNGGVWGSLTCSGGGGGSGTVTVVGGGNLTNTAIVTGGGLQTVQTPNNAATMDASGNISTPGQGNFGVGSGGSGIVAWAGGNQSTSLSIAPTNSTGWIGPATVAAGKHFFQVPNTGGAAANQIFLFGAESGNVSAASLVTFQSSNLTDGANLVTAASAAAAANQVCESSGASKTCTYVDFPDVKIVPAANCNNATAGAGWDIPASNAPTVACRAGTNNLGGVLQWANNNTTTNAQFSFELPADWDTGTQPFIEIWYGSGANTSGTVKWTFSTACTKGDGSVTDDPAFNAESATAGNTMAVANRMWKESVQFTLVTSGNNCVAPSNVIVKVTSGNGTATSTVNVSKVVLTIPRRPVVQAN